MKTSDFMVFSLVHLKSTNKVPEGFSGRNIDGSWNFPTQGKTSSDKLLVMRGNLDHQPEEWGDVPQQQSPERMTLHSFSCSSFTTEGLQIGD